jgi:hypothetical protein
MKNTYPAFTAADADAIARHIATKGVTRCPTACANVRTTGRPDDADRAALANIWAQQEAAREGRKARFRRMI